jgi:hypothetical protein
MSAWILGSEIAGSLGLQDFEFVQEHVLRGLIPHNHQGQPYTPSDVVSQVIAELEEELAQHDDLAWSLSGNDREEIIANRINPLQRRIQSYLDYRQSLTDATWNGFILPDEHELSARFIGVLLNSYYRRDEVYKRLSPESEPVPDQEPAWPAKIPVQVEKPAKQRKLRPEQKDRIACRAMAEILWRENPEITISEMIFRDEIAKACHIHYKDDKTIRNWIKDLAPSRKPGRRKKKKA